MIEIKILNYDDMKEVMELKLLCWPEEIAGLSNIQLSYQEEFAFWTTWMNAEQENHDIRKLYGAFEHGKLLGVAFGSFVESKNVPEEGFELNGLWVYPQHRRKGIALQLILKLLDDFYELEANKIIIYNFHHAPSNQFYRKLGCEVIGTEYQTADKVPVDIFACDVVLMKQNIMQLQMCFAG